jgi:hypothetical protein
VRNSAAACCAQVIDMCKGMVDDSDDIRLHSQINETSARLMKDIGTSEQVLHIYVFSFIFCVWMVDT